MTPSFFRWALLGLVTSVWQVLGAPMDCGELEAGQACWTFSATSASHSNNDLYISLTIDLVGTQCPDDDQDNRGYAVIAAEGDWDYGFDFPTSGGTNCFYPSTGGNVFSTGSFAWSGNEVVSGNPGALWLVLDNPNYDYTYRIADSLFEFDVVDYVGSAAFVSSVPASSTTMLSATTMTQSTATATAGVVTCDAEVCGNLTTSQRCYGFSATAAVEEEVAFNVYLTIDTDKVCGEGDDGFRIVNAKGYLGSPVVFSPNSTYQMPSQCFYPNGSAFFDYSGFSFSAYGTLVHFHKIDTCLHHGRC